MKALLHLQAAMVRLVLGNAGTYGAGSLSNEQSYSDLHHTR